MPGLSASKRLRIGRYSEVGRIYLLTANTLHREAAFADWQVGRFSREWVNTRCGMRSGFSRYRRLVIKWLRVLCTRSRVNPLPLALAHPLCKTVAPTGFSTNPGGTTNLGGSGLAHDSYFSTNPP
jgi:hypothetical protein